MKKPARRRAYKVEPGKYVRLHAHVKPVTRAVIEELAGDFGLGVGLDRLARIYRKKIQDSVFDTSSTKVGAKVRAE